MPKLMLSGKRPSGLPRAKHRSRALRWHAKNREVRQRIRTDDFGHRLAAVREPDPHGLHQTIDHMAVGDQVLGIEEPG